MITKIQPAAEKIINTLIYNELKMSGPEGILTSEELEEYDDAEMTGHILATRNVPETSDLENEFARLKMLNKKNTRGRALNNPGFHMSVNPSENEIRVDEAKIVSFIDELMDKLGYAEVPYRIYKHTDIEREHYHVIATRIGQDGKKINDSFENRRCNKFTDELCKKYGFSLGKLDNAESTKNIKDTSAESPKQIDVNKQSKHNKTKESDNDKTIVMPFKHDNGESVEGQLKNIHADAMTWSFSTPEQYVAILKYRYNTSADIVGESLSYQGLDKDGNPTHPPINETELNLNALFSVVEKCENSDMKNKKSQKRRIEKIAKECAEKASSWKEFKKMMSKKGVYTVISWSENDEPFGITWLDRATRCAFKGSETAITLSWIKQLADSKGWQISRDRRYEKKIQSENKKKAVERLRRYSTDDGLKNLSLIKAVGRTHGTNNSAAYNKDRLKKEDEAERNDIIL